MKVFDKIKNLFTDEVEEEVKSEMIQVEIPAPAKPEVEKKEEDITDNKIIKSEEKPSAPIFFDDDYFKELEKPKKEVKSSYKKEEKVKEEKKVFRPTPIISPVYGVLDKDYQKEEITTKEEKTYKTNTIISIDEVRRKAFGGLEEDLENTLFGSKSILFSDKTNDNEEIKDDDNTDLFDEMTKEDTIDLELSNENNEEDTIGENELFDMIDKIYEDGDKK